MLLESPGRGSSVDRLATTGARAASCQGGHQLLVDQGSQVGLRVLSLKLLFGPIGEVGVVVVVVGLAGGRRHLR